MNGRAGARHIFNHRWDDPATYAQLGAIPARDIADLTGGRLREDVPVALNRLATEYDHVLICGPVFPHEVAGFSGGTKYLFPGIAAPEIIHFTHWLGALDHVVRSDRHDRHAVRAVINRAAALLDTPLSLLALVVTHHGVAGMYCGDVHEAWRQAATLSSQRHIVWVDEPYDRVLAIMPAMYDDLWTAGEGHVQERARRGGRRRGDHLRAARHGSEPHARPDDRRGRLSLPRLLSRAVGSLREISGRHPRALDAREGERHLRRGDERRGPAHTGDARDRHSAQSTARW